MTALEQNSSRLNVGFGMTVKEKLLNKVPLHQINACSLGLWGRGSHLPRKGEKGTQRT